MIYEPNDKHKKPWQRGRRGSLCPPDISPDDAERMLASSIRSNRKRFATDGVRAYCAQEHSEGRWHGYPVGWEEVPPRVRRELVEHGSVDRRDVKRYWAGEPS